MGGAPLAEQVGQRVTYYYDSNPLDGSYSANAWGRLAAVGFAGNYSYMYSYNAAGRVTKQYLGTDTTGNDGERIGFDTAYSWDNEGRMTSIGYPGGGLLYSNAGPVYGMQFDAMGRVGSMVDGGTTVASASYGSAGEVTGLNYFGVSETRTYNSLLQMTRQTAVMPGRRR